MEERGRKGFHWGAFIGGLFIGLLVAVAVGLIFFMILQGKIRQLTAANKSEEGYTVTDSESDGPTGLSGITVSGDKTGTSDGMALNEDTIETLDMIESYFDQGSIYSIDDEDLRRGMIDGMVEASGDKYAQYFTQEEFDYLMTDYSGVFYGIGAMIFMSENNEPTISGIYEDSPAEKAGMKTGDIIVAVDDTDVYDMTLEEVVKMIRGEKGTQVVVKVYREGKSDYLDLPMTREEVQKKTVNYEMLEDTDSIGYIQLTTFEEITAKQFGEALQDLKSRGMKSLIIDLRSNTGGLLTACVSICQQVLPEGLIVYTEDVNGKTAEYKSDGSNAIDIPVVILIDGYTASASEIMTGAMKDHGVATVIGVNTYGKGVVQGFYQMKDYGVLKLTMEQYFTPSGKAIDGEGIAPDYEVELDREAYLDETNPSDNQLQAGIDFLEGREVQVTESKEKAEK